MVLWYTMSLAVLKIGFAVFEQNIETFSHGSESIDA